MISATINLDEMADLMEKSLDMIGIENVFEFFGTTRKEYIKRYEKILYGDNPILINPVFGDRLYK